ncbi:MAG TPA: hypothetical protein VNV86_00490 [Candidatus Acidoferrum sp.]|nr:hypothetical protein [Candidatus Acidoferrum sp.]
MNRVATASLCLAFALLTFFQFPGHTWLQQDTQIYAPILEHLHDPAVLRNDIVVQQPHVAYTLYDEIALGLRRVTGSGFREILQAQQIATRALGFWGLLLLAEALGLGFGGAITVAAICSLGAVVAGPAVLTVEYEPSPRAFAFPLVVLAMGLAAHGRYRAAGVAGGVALLYHPPTALAFWGIWVVLCILPGKAAWDRRQALYGLGFAAAILRIAADGQRETQTFVAHLSPLNEMLQRLRASYVWVSAWPWQTIAQHVMLFAVLVAAFWRVRGSMGRDTKTFLVVLPALGLLSMPVSWLLLEQWKWGVIPQVQPMRTLLFITFAMQLLCAVAGVRAERRAEAAGWFALAFLPTLPFTWGGIALAAAMGVAAAMAGRWMPAVAVAAFFVVPGIGGVVNYPRLQTAELAQVSEWARAHTSADATFLFADAPRGLDAGVFRTDALRAVYVDWKGGGQVNYLSDFGEQWWFRWQQTLAKKFSPSDLPRYEALGIRYVVLRKEHRMAADAAYENARYVVYELR